MTDRETFITPHRRLRLACVAAAVLLVVAALAVAAWDRPISDAMRLEVPRADRSASVAWQVLEAVKNLGKADLLVVLAALVGLWGKKRAAVAAILALAITGAVVTPLKAAVGRTRPSGKSSKSFPSGDAAAAAALAAPFALVSPALGAAAAVSAGVVAVERVVLAKHYPSDVCAGLAIGFLAGAAALSPRLAPSARVRRALRRSWFALAPPVLLLVRWIDDPHYFSVLVETCVPAIALGVAAPFLRARRRPLLSPRAATAAVVALALAALLFTASRSTLWDRDEPRYARATVEMIESGNYLVPTFNGEWRLHKPPLIYWLMSLSVRALGPTEVACRLFAPIGMALALLLTARLAARIAAPGAGALAAVVLATSPLALVSGSAATTDAVLLATIVAGLAAVEAGLDRPRLVHAAALAVALAAATLVKGPVGLAVVGLGAAAALALLGRARAVLSPRLVVPALVAAAAALAWAVPANAATGGELWRQGFGEHVIDRALRPKEGHGGAWLLYLPYYVPALALGVFPWTLAAPAALSAAAGGRVGGARGRALLLAWIVPTFALFSVVSTKLPHYVLPIVPALAIAVAGTVEAARRGGLAPRDVAWLARGRALFVAIAVAGGLALLVGAWLLPPEANLADPVVGIGVVLLAMAALARRDRAPQRLPGLARALAAGAIAIWAAGVLWALPRVERIKVSKPIADAIRASAGADVPVFARGYDEPSLVFYLGRPVEKLRRDEDVLRFARDREAGRAVLVATREALARIEAASGPLGLAEIAAARGYNYTKGRWVEVVALDRPSR